ncbi:modifier of mdg4-like isoform X18 [Anopheles darlingi]|uniref:modifier of mdg4-like isoform X18 n=1 Tax=Anopheles darlingi TaxID=43151 RepID=UPI0021004646|nr:modifier of mdg4-like isoform X18 [Anopheles darlingi]XP_049532482.1 modifier of mdg4-like isoform X18 [Anopheles darlingi]
MADDEQFSLCWNNFNTNLSAGFHDSLVQGDLVDVTLAAEGHLVKAHRLILSVCSPYFRKMFMQMPVNQHAFIFLKDVSHSVLKDLIQFMYCGEVNVKQEALPGFISTAEALQIKGLTETGDSAPPQASPAKEIPSTPAPVSISTANIVPSRGKSQRTRAQSYKLESEESGDDKIVQIQTPASHHTSPASQQVQQVQQLHVASAQKRVLGQRHVQPSQITKRAKLSVSSTDVLDSSDSTTQIQTVQIVKQLPSQTAEPEYVDLAMEPLNAKAEPDYVEEQAEIETVEAETEQDQSLTENEQTADQEQEQGDDGDQYVDDDGYGELAKYEDSYFTEGEDGKAGASGFGESYASDGTSNEQASQEKITFSPVKVSRRTKSDYTSSKYDIDQDGKLFKTMEAAEFGISQRGARKLIYQGFQYVKDRDFPDSTNWRCALFKRHKCRARAITKYVNGVVCVRPSNFKHNHPVDDYRRSAAFDGIKSSPI